VSITYMLMTLGRLYTRRREIARGYKMETFKSFDLFLQPVQVESIALRLS